jgi:hypothetical protein
MEPTDISWPAQLDTKVKKSLLSLGKSIAIGIGERKE